MSTENGTTALFTRILHWLTGAYPHGVGADDRGALIALLARTLDAEQIYTAMSILTPEVIDPGVDRFIARDQVDEAVRDGSLHPAAVADTRRVSGKLAAAGWPLDGFV